MTPKPAAKPARPWFSAGPTAKRPGWALANLPTNLMGRGIRAPEVVERFAHGLRLTREVLGPPDDHVMLYTPGSDTGAVEAALWCMLGERPVQVVAYENFGQVWATDVRDHLKLEPEVLTAPWGELPDLSRVDPKKDVVFPWNGTTSGVRVPDGDWIADDREGLTICDATSAAFAMDLPWDKLDVTTFSFQKALGGEAGIGLMVLSPRAVARLDTYRPDRAVPKVLRIVDKKGFDRTLADGVVMNTFSVLTIEDWIDALDWAKGAGGLPALIARTDATTTFEVGLYSGRPHQIRIHLASIGHPLVGDPLYGANGQPLEDHPGLPGDGGYLLHAHRLNFEHPITGEPIHLEAALPSGLAAHR